jgi:IS5 family transposase
LFAYLSYRDAPAAIDWLEAIGFELVTRQPGDDGAVLHAELSRGDAVVMLASADADSTVHRASAARPVEGSNSRSTAALNRRSPTASSTIAPSSSLQAVNNPTHDARADDLARYRVGCEGRLSHLKRRYGLRRSRLKGHHGTRTWVGSAILTYNLDTLAIRPH